jgi:hypothetical protein
MDKKIVTSTGFEFDTTVRLKDKIVSLYRGGLFGIFAYTFLLLIFYFVSLLRFRRPKDVTITTVG